MDFALTEDQKALQQKARNFAINEVLPVARKYDESEEFPIPVIKKAWEEGLLNLGIPKQYGGPGYGLVEACIVVEEISSACPGMATSIFDNNLGAEPIVIGGNEEQKTRILGE
ncbi:MAG: acyl-CoA dehydrogenase family protein, partial [Candidatus Lokiarchaeota archaeon]|nr:acyl-CoA dehydrogenase family protein [Candidatus Lokiarchaeota archaeon]